jgi:hypothetical protein
VAPDVISATQRQRLGGSQFKSSPGKKLASSYISTKKLGMMGTCNLSSVGGIGRGFGAKASPRQ